MKFAKGLGLIVAEQYGHALTRITLSSGDKGAVTRLSSDVDEPTSLELAEGSAWVSEGQLSNLTGTATTPLDLPFRVRRIPLPK
jgi:hypothetical protein